MLKKYLFFILAIIAISVLITGCSSSSSAERQSGTSYGNIEEEFEQAPPQVVTPTTPPAAVTTSEESSKEAVYTVQLGAFENIGNVERFEKLIKSKFTAPIKTEFDDASGYYKVSVGQFSSKDEAYKLRDFCVQNGYKDAWVTTTYK
jgi:cell division septation protein DedD